jgi:ZIP family zinc transporter
MTSINFDLHHERRLDMATNVGGVLGFACIPAIAVVLGGFIAAFRAPGPAVRSGVQHIAAGVLFAALATELLPDVIHRKLPWVTLIGFALGVVAMLGLKAATRKMESKDSSGLNAALPVSLLLASAIDIALDGLLIGVSFTASSRQGILITIAMTMEVMFLGVAVASALTGPGSKTRVLGTTVAFAALLLAGAAVGNYLLAGLNAFVIDAVMAFAVAALLYLVTEELLTEAHEVDETPLLASMFFVGFIVLLMIEMLV